LQLILPIKLERSSERLTSLGGLAVLEELARVLGLWEKVDRALEGPKLGRGYGLREFAQALVWMLLSVPVKKNISSAGLVSSSPVGGDAVKNSIVVSKFSAILAFYFRVSANRCSVRVPGGNCLRLWPCELRLA